VVEVDEFDVQNSFLSGLFGYHNETQINGLGVILFKPYQKEELNNFY